jgi:hypothetical protein
MTTLFHILYGLKSISKSLFKFYPLNYHLESHLHKIHFLYQSFYIMFVL